MKKVKVNATLTLDLNAGGDAEDTRGTAEGHFRAIFSRGDLTKSRSREHKDHTKRGDIHRNVPLQKSELAQSRVQG